MLRRLGNKTRLLPKLLSLFPENITIFIDMFMGSGAVTFAMVDRCKHIIANDNDREVLNLFMVMKNNPSKLLHDVAITPYHEGIFQHWKSSEESEPLWKAIKFVYMNNYSFFGNKSSLRYDTRNHKENLLSAMDSTLNKIGFVKFLNNDFREVLSKISIEEHVKPQFFIYADPPYLETDDNYAESFTEDDTRDLFSILTGSGIRFALSEFRHPLVMALAEEHGLHVTSLGERRNLKNRREELLITNYHPVRQQIPLFASPCMEWTSPTREEAVSV